MLSYNHTEIKLYIKNENISLQKSITTGPVFPLRNLLITVTFQAMEISSDIMFSLVTSLFKKKKTDETT